ncbi:lysis system i-spanin subunit Rz [Providencia alcalifaciens]|uniref:lysis system i-spanin subunit Rz n=1 Tax=Providencia alcalifaciens TaxID=126385 RepID=UPI001CC558C0|nr:lysis system i-spanin subunit Rz [Providencia alcalifaciens]
MDKILRNIFLYPAKRALIVVISLLFFVAIFVSIILTSYYYQTIIQTNKADYASRLKVISDEAEASIRQSFQRTQEAIQEKQKLDEYYHGELINAQKESQDLRDDLYADRRRLQLTQASLATCQHTTNDHSITRSMGDGAEVRFSVEAGLLVQDIRTGIKLDQDKLEYLQQYVKKIVRSCEKDLAH